MELVNIYDTRRYGSALTNTKKQNPALAMPVEDFNT